MSQFEREAAKPHYKTVRSSCEANFWRICGAGLSFSGRCVPGAMMIKRITILPLLLAALIAHPVSGRQSQARCQFNIGGISIGMTREQVRAVLGKHTVVIDQDHWASDREPPSVICFESRTVVCVEGAALSAGSRVILKRGESSKHILEVLGPATEQFRARKEALPNPSSWIYLCGKTLLLVDAFDHVEWFYLASVDFGLRGRTNGVRDRIPYRRPLRLPIVKPTSQ